jgi:hypothetical protein
VGLATTLEDPVALPMKRTPRLAGATAAAAARASARSLARSAKEDISTNAKFFCFCFFAFCSFLVFLCF